jgi:hypothetical protein
VSSSVRLTLSKSSFSGSYSTSLLISCPIMFSRKPASSACSSPPSPIPKSPIDLSRPSSDSGFVEPGVELLVSDYHQPRVLRWRVTSV